MVLTTVGLKSGARCGECVPGSGWPAFFAASRRAASTAPTCSRIAFTPGRWPYCEKSSDAIFGGISFTNSGPTAPCTAFTMRASVSGSL